MKNTLLITFLLTVVASFSQVTLPYYEPFNYDSGLSIIEENSDGSAGLGPWRVVNSTGTGSPDPLIVDSPFWSTPAGFPFQQGNAASWQGGSTDPSFEFAPINTSAYASFLLRVTNMDDLSDANGGFIFSFYKLSSTGGNSYTSTVYLKRATNPVNGTFYLGIGETNTGSSVSPAGAPTGSQCKYDSTLYTVDTDYFIVVSYDIVAQTAYMWINPAVGGSQPTATVDTSHDTNTGGRPDLIYARLSAESNARTPNLIFDELRVGTSWAEVTPTTLSLSDEKISSFKVYPNPARDYVTIESPSVKITSVDMFSFLGKKVLSESTLVNNRLNVSTLSKGIYFMKINAAGGSVTKKVVIE